MEELSKRRVCDSLTQQIQIILPEHINGFGRLFGGQLVVWVDIVAAVVARRHSGRNVTTVAIDNLQFKAAAYVNDTVLIKGTMTWVGNTSMEVHVETFVESLSGKQSLVNRAYLVLVALDEEENPVQVPGLLLETEEEKAEWEAGVKRRRLRSKRKREEY